MNKIKSFLFMPVKCEPFFVNLKINVRKRSQSLIAAETSQIPALRININRDLWFSKNNPQVSVRTVCSLITQSRLWANLKHSWIYRAIHHCQEKPHKYSGTNKNILVLIYSLIYSILIRVFSHVAWSCSLWSGFIFPIGTVCLGSSEYTQKQPHRHVWSLK